MSEAHDSAGITRRDFMKIIFETASAAAVSGYLVDIWPRDASARPEEEPYRLLALQDGYIVDPNFDYDTVVEPTNADILRRDYGFIWKRDQESRKQFFIILCYKQYSDFFAEIEDPNDLDSSFDEQIESYLYDPEFSSLGPYNAAKFTEYGPAIEIFDSLSYEDRKRLGVGVVHGDGPGSDFVGVRFDGDLKKLNEELARLGMNLVIDQE